MVNMNRGLEPIESAAMRRLSHLRGKLASRTFYLVENFSGITEVQVATSTGEKLDRVTAAIAQLMDGDLLVEYPVYSLPDGQLTSDREYWKTRTKELRVAQGLENPAPEPLPDFHMYYLSDEGTIVAEHRDTSSLARIRRRVHEDIRKDHHAGEQNQMLHTLRLNDCVASLAAAGLEVSAGYRACLYLPGNRQLVPDAYMEAILDLGEHAVEVVRGNPGSKVFRKKVRKQVLRYVSDARKLSRLEVTYVCENDTVRSVVREVAADVCREQQVDLHAVPVLDSQVTAGPARAGSPEVGRPVLMRLSLLIEYEQTAVEPSQIREKLMPLVRVAPDVPSLAVGFICETQAAADRFEEEHRRLQRAHQVSFILLTSTLEKVTKRGRRGALWSMNGEAVRLI